MLLTSYHAVSRAGDIAISKTLSRWSPKGVIHYPRLAPNNVIRGADPFKLDNETYIKMFLDGLARIDPKEIYEELCHLSKGNTPCINCYEKPVDMCHRHIVAWWISDNLNIKTEERNLPKGLVFNRDLYLYEEPFKQGSLF